MTGTQCLRVVVALFVGAAFAGCGQEKAPAPPPAVVVTPPPTVVVTPPPTVVVTPPATTKATGAEKAGWKLLGQQLADRKRDADRVEIAAGAGAIREIEITVEGAPLDMESMVVTFANGEQFKPAIRHSFKENSRSRAIDVPGDKRNIRHIDFVYRSVGAARDGRATIKIYGR